ncbi:nucleoplasmin-2 [Tamandua tetradactyla]|uniref:nucleoplasmin-2 n=1 Tax=Tamandua tetradactyla TaxID=48850 RepID=UPI0040546990
MNRSRFEKAITTMLWGCELNQEKPAWTFQPQLAGKQDCKLMLSTICLGEKAKNEMNLVEVLPPAKESPVTIASLQASILPMVALTGLELSPPVTFQLRAGSGPVFLSGQEWYAASRLPWEEEEEEEEEEVEEEEEEEEEDEDEEEEDDEDVSPEETPVKQVKRPAPQKRSSVAKKKRLEKEEGATRCSPQVRSPGQKHMYPVSFGASGAPHQLLVAQTYMLMDELLLNSHS